MNTKKRFTLIITLILLGVAALAAVTRAAPGEASLAGGAPAVVAYQGEVRVTGTPYTGDGYFKFAIVNAAGSVTYWSNDGSSAGGGEPTAAVELPVSEGLFGLLLGDTALGGMTQALTADVFSQPDRCLRVWFSASSGGPFSQLTPDTRIAAVPYALQAQEAADADTVDGEHASAFADATHGHTPGDITPQGTGSSLDADTVDGLHASELGTHYQNVVIVAKSGGDYTSVQAAINSITDAAADNPYLVWVAPGVYNETVTMKSYVHLQGAGQEATIITSTASNSNSPPTQATLVLTRDVSLRDLTVGNEGSGAYNVALLATDGTTRTLAADVTARTLGSGAENYGVYLAGSGTDVTLQQVTALAKDGIALNFGLLNNAVVILRGGSFTGRGGAYARGINNAGTLNAESITALGENGSDENYGLYNLMFAEAMLRGSSFTARGGDDAWGIYNGNSATLEAESVTALAEGSSYSYGLDNGGAAILRGGSFTGRGGYAHGIANSDSGTTLEAENVTALGENGASNNYGLRNISGAAATLRGGSFTGRGGNNANGINNYGTGTTLEAEIITALGENSSSYNYGLDNNAAATLRGGSFTGSGGNNANGIYNCGTSATLEADSVTVMSDNSSGINYGLFNWDGAAATLRGGSFIGRAGVYAYGIYNYGGGTTLDAESVTALGENGTSDNFGLYNRGSAAATLRGSSFTGRGGTYARGIYNYGGSTTLEAESVTALGEGGGSSNYGLRNSSSATTANVTQSVLEGATNSVYRSSGTVTISNSRLIGGAASATVTCVAVSRGTTFNANGCP